MEDRPPDRRGGEVAIFVHQSVKYSSIKDCYDCDGSMEVCSVEIHLESRPLVIYSYYRPPASQSISSKSWIEFLNQSKYRSLFCGDFNIHHFFGRDSICSPIGNNFVKALDNSDFYMLNDEVVLLFIERLIVRIQ